MRSDVSDPDAVEALAREADARFGGVDLVVNNAGVAVGGEVGAIPVEDWRWIVSINLMGVVHGCHAFAPRLRAQRAGHVINVASAAGLVASPGMAAYNATKFGVVGLSEALYAELAPFGVGVTVLCPTFFPTQIVDSARGAGGEALTAMAKKLMAASKLDAGGVARAALQAADAGRMYCVPMRDGRAMWALKRLAPEQWHARVGPLLLRLAQKRFG
jgi:short-subunit dehydrogenase